MGKGLMFMLFVWLVVCIAGNVLSGQVDFVRTTTTAAISDTDTTIYVRSTEGYPDTGVIVCEDEHIAYSVKTATTFAGDAVRPLIRGAEGTTAVAHSLGKQITTVPGAMLNASAAYNVSAMTDSSGALVFVSVPLAFFSLLVGFFFLPLQYFGTDLQILSMLWVIVVIGMLGAITMQMAGGRRAY